MSGTDLIPIIIPSAIFQIIMQIYYIRHCHTSKKMTKGQRIFYIGAIAVFGLIAISVYLFKIKEESGAESVGISENVSRGIFLLLVVAFEVLAMNMLAENLGNDGYILIIVLLNSCFILMILHNLFVRRNSFLYHLIPAIQLLLSIPLLYLDAYYDSLFILLIMSLGFINIFPLHLAKIYAISGLSTFLVGGTARSIREYSVSNVDEIVRYLYVNTLVFLFAVFAFYILKRQILTNIQLDAALQKVTEQSSQLRDMAVLAERNRIAAEIHDTVGHTLTGAVLSIEEAESLILNHPDKASEKLAVAMRQVKTSLKEIRSSVRIIRSGTDKTFSAALEELVQEIHENTGLIVRYVMDVQSNLLPLQAGILLAAVKESSTNALKHGQASEADILVQEHMGVIRLTFTDNGKGISNISFGSGLTIMRERVESIGGILEAGSEYGEGFTVNISVPIGDKRRGLYE